MIIAGTGHRPDKLGGFGPEPFIKCVKVISAWLEINKPKAAISGLAVGFDQALAKAAIDLKIPVIGAIPFKGQESKWPTASRIAYKHLVSQCSEIVVVSDGGYSAHKMQKRNEWMVDRIVGDIENVLLSMHDGSDGGTKNCIDYAKNKYPYMKIVNLYEQWKKA